MNIAILSRHPELYSTQRLRKSADERGHEARIVNFNRCYIGVASATPEMIYGGERLRTDVVIPRVGVANTFYGTAVVRQFEVMGIPVVNSSAAILQSRDKIRALQRLAAAGVASPATGIAHSTKDIDGLIEMVGGPPLVIKMMEGTHGAGVVLAETRKAAESVIAAFRQLQANILVQEFIAEADGTDVRCLVVGGEVVAAMERHAPPGDFRANLHLGGVGESTDLTDEEREIAECAAASLGLGLAGVDLIRSERGPLVIEVNSSPGFEGIEQATGVDIANAVIDLTETLANDSDS